MDDQKREKLRGQPRSVKKQSPISSFHSRRAVTRAAAAPGDAQAKVITRAAHESSTAGQRVAGEVLQDMSMTRSEREEPNLYPESEQNFTVNKQMAIEFMALGFNIEHMGPILIVTRGKERCALFETETTFTSLTAFRLLKDKELCRHLFQQAGVSLADGFAFTRTQKSLALEKLREINPAVIKPVSSNKGKGVSVNVTTETFEPAWLAAWVPGTNKVLVEKFFANGNDA